MRKSAYVLSGVLAMGLLASPVLADHKNGGEHYHGKWLEKLDTDGNGSVSLEEYQAKHTDWFNQADTNGDGELSADELKTAQQDRREKMKEKIKEKRAQE